jgi:hypothetical protein
MEFSEHVSLIVAWGLARPNGLNQFSARLLGLCLKMGFFFADWWIATCMVANWNQCVGKFILPGTVKCQALCLMIIMDDSSSSSHN